MTARTTQITSLAILAGLLLAGQLFAQAQSGNLFGTLTDVDGGVLPGVTVTLEGGGAPQMQITDEKGAFRFLGLSPGEYAITAVIDGFATVNYPGIVISVNRNTSITIEMSPAIQETITVTSESPLLDSRKIATGTSLNQIELEKVPTSRDPWSVLQTIPGVKTDRINVGGNESGQQSFYTGPGSSGDDAVWAVDGVVITDMSAIGGSPSYYNFDAFEEMQATTGGSDASLATGGVTLNMVTKRGTNEWRGSARYIRADDNWQSDLDLSSGEFGGDFDAEGPALAQEEFAQGNRIVSIEDWGAEIGGPIHRDKVWIWAHYGLNDIGLLTVDDFSDATELENYGAKLNAQLADSNSLVAFYDVGEKIKIGRNAGPTRPQPTTWNQSGPTEILKLEDTHVFSSSFFLTGMLSTVDSEFMLTPQGGLDGPPPVLDVDFVWQNNFIHYETVRPQDQAKIDGNFFFNTGDTSHELRFGVGYREVGLESTSIWPGGGVRLDFYGPNPGDNMFQVSRTLISEAETTYESAFVQDTLQMGRLTINAGLRFDRQDGRVEPVTVPGVPGFEFLPDGTPVAPTVTTPGFDQPFDWTDVTPRVGVTWALGENNDTLVRASYARFAEQLRQGYTTFTAPVAPGNYNYAYFYYEDRNGDELVTLDEILDFAAGPVFTNGYDPLGQSSPNAFDPDFEAPKTDEIILAVEHSLRPELLVGATVTWRRISDVVEQERMVRDLATGEVRAHLRSDYVFDRDLEATLPDGTLVTTPFLVLDDGRVEDLAGRLLTNGDREQDYQGLSLFIHKRLADRWMLRGNLTFQDWEWDVPLAEQEDPNLFLGGFYDDGGPVLQGSGTGSGSKGGVYIHSGWAYSLTGMYQVAPEKNWGFNVSAALNGREGYPIPYFHGRVSGFAEGAFNTNVQATGDSDSFRLDDVHTVDLRVEKDFELLEEGSFTLGVELFNAFNESTVLQRQHQLELANSNHVQEVLSPRVFRVGVRFRWR